MKHYACAVLSAENRILLGKRAPHRRAYPGCWDVIGGMVEDGETAEAALARELTEELGIVPTEYSTLGVIEDHNLNARGNSIYHLFVVTGWDGGIPALRDDEHSQLKWFDIETACALPDLALNEYHALFRRILEPR